MTKVSAELAERLATKIADCRSEADWQESLWDSINIWTSGQLDTKQTDILFDMIVARWDRAKRPTVFVTDDKVNLFDAAHAA